MKELDGPAISVIWRAIVEAKQRWSVIGWVTKHLLSRVTPCIGKHEKSLVLAAFAVVSTHQHALGAIGGLWPVLLMCNLCKAINDGDVEIKIDYVQTISI
jgi:hypothetical protein